MNVLDYQNNEEVTPQGIKRETCLNGCYASNNFLLKIDSISSPGQRQKNIWQAVLSVGKTKNKKQNEQYPGFARGHPPYY
jgi:hypothetical protein